MANGAVPWIYGMRSLRPNCSLEPHPPTPHPFSPREFEVLTLAADGLTNKEIAYRLGLSVALALQRKWIVVRH